MPSPASLKYDLAINVLSLCIADYGHFRSWLCQKHSCANLVRSSADGALRYPLDVVKTRVQLQQGKGLGDEGYNGMLDCFRKIIKNEGPSRLYRGITAPILMEAPKR